MNPFRLGLVQMSCGTNASENLDKAAAFFKARGLRHGFIEAPYQGRTLQVTDPFGMPVELYFKMEKRERLLQLYGRYQGVHAQRLDHFNIFSPELQDAVDFYALLGFRMTEYTEEEGSGGRIVAAWMHRKGNVHDLAFTNGRGRGCTTWPIGCRHRSTSSICAT